MQKKKKHRSVENGKREMTENQREDCQRDGGIIYFFGLDKQKYGERYLR